MQITLNGQPHELAEPLTVSGLLAVLGLPERKIAVERNREIVPKSSYDEELLDDGDRIEIVQFVGGG